MKKRRNIIIVIVLSLILIGVGGSLLYNFLADEDLFTVAEKKYLVDNKSNLVTINVLNDVNVFGYDGKGVYYDFLKSFEDNNEISFNIVPTLSGSNVQNLSLTKSSVLPSNAKVIYTDHYVLVGKERINIITVDEVNRKGSSSNKTIGFLSRDKDVVRDLNEYSLSLKNYDDRSSLLEGFKNGEVSYMIVPLIEYLDVILSNSYVILYHLSDMKDYYYLLGSSDETLSSIINKYYNKWSNEKFVSSFNKSEFDLFVDKLKITEKELDAMNSKTYRYGFVNNGPYDIKAGGVYGGTMSKYIKGFKEFSGIDFSYDEYSNFEKFKRAISRGNVDLFMNYYSIETSMSSIESLYRMDISFLMSNSDERVVNSLSAIKNETVYVREDSLIVPFVKESVSNVKTYKNEKELKSIFEKKGIVAMGYSNFMIYSNKDSNVSERFRIKSDKNLMFQSKNDTTFNKLFAYYISTIDKNNIMYTGIDDYNKTLMSGTFIYKIAKYSIIIILGLGLFFYVSYKVSKKAFVRKKIKRNEKIKYIDLLTSLKNRNYLSENIPIWNQNTIYPQSIVIVDLNSVQELNDTYGYIEGDKQIQATANALIKTQLDNSEIMRTDGNEFTVYLVGYNEKQIISYIKKLNKEFKNLPHDKGAAVGFSMIEDDVKLVSDAINEATEKMKENKKMQFGDADEDKA